MARKSYGRTSSLLNVGTYQDDDSYPVGSNEWNANHSDDGVIGFDKSAQAISGNNNINVTDSFIEITTADSASGGSNDGIYTLAAITTAHSTTNYPADTSNSNVKLRSNASSYSEGDLIYVVKAAGQAATTLRHQQGGAGAGKITTLDGEHKVLSATVPTILMARTISGNVEWIEYGGGAVTTPTDITVADESSDATCFPLFVTAVTGDLAPKTGTNLAFNSSSGVLTATGFAGALTGAVTGNADTATSATTATTATNVTVADESSDTSCNVLFSTAATGNLPPKSGTNLTFNSSSGLLTATLFAGDGDLTVNGTTTTIDTATLSVEDPLINMASGNNAADSVDIGFYGLYDTSGSQDLYAGLFRDANDSGKWKLFKDNQAAPTTTVNTGGTGYAVGTLVANLEGNATGTAATVTGAAQTAITSVGVLTSLEVSGRFEMDKGSDVVAAGTITLAGGGNTFDITGATGINTITTTDWEAGSVVHLQFDATPVITHTASGAGKIKLGDQGNMTAVAGDVLSLFFNGTEWVEISRSSVSSGGGATDHHTFNLQSSSYTSNAPSGAERSVIIRTIDSYNEGVFVRCKKNNVANTEVQIA